MEVRKWVQTVLYVLLLLLSLWMLYVGVRDATSENGWLVGTSKHVDEK